MCMVTIVSYSPVSSSNLIESGLASVTREAAQGYEPGVSVGNAIVMRRK